MRLAIPWHADTTPQFSQLPSDKAVFLKAALEGRLRSAYSESRMAGLANFLADSLGGIPGFWKDNRGVHRRTCTKESPERSPEERPFLLISPPEQRPRREAKGIPIERALSNWP